MNDKDFDRLDSTEANQPLDAASPEDPSKEKSEDFEGEARNQEVSVMAGEKQQTSPGEDTPSIAKSTEDSVDSSENVISLVAEPPQSGCSENDPDPAQFAHQAIDTSAAPKAHSSGSTEGTNAVTPRMVIAVASGKGGVGKSLLSASLGIYLAQIGKRVIVVDANLGSGNLHTLLGINDPEVSLHSFLCKNVKHVKEVVADTPFRGLGLIPSHNNTVGTTHLRQAQKTRLLQQIRSLPADYVVIDLPGGSDYNTLDIFLVADLHVIVTQPEPTAIESAFRFIKSAFIRHVRSIAGTNQLTADLQAQAHFGIPTPNQLYEIGRERDSSMGKALKEVMGQFKPRLILNNTRTRDDLELGPALAQIGRRHLRLPFDYLGYIENDDVVWVTVRKRRPLLVEFPKAKISKDIERIVRRILSLETKEAPECVNVPKPLVSQNHYEILALHPGASDEEVRRAHRRAKVIYSPDSLATFGIAPTSEINEMLRRIETAHSTLIDHDKRHIYDQNLFPSGVNKSTSFMGHTSVLQEPVLLLQGTIDPPALEDRPKMPLINKDTEFTGTLLRSIREAHGIDLQEISDRTKISKTYLRAIEEEDFASTPALVYLRGFVKTLARELKLDAEQVAKTYSERCIEAQNRLKAEAAANSL